MTFLDLFHGGYVHPRRIRVLRDALADLIPFNARVLDVGAGDGRIAAEILERRPDLEMSGIDVLVRSDTQIPVAPFDGKRIPYDDGTFDTVMFVDVLHHTDDPAVLLREARRVARRGVVIKDHLLDGYLARETLTLMDWVGNARHGVHLPNNYWCESNWRRAFDDLGLEVVRWQSRLDLYPFPASLVFGRSLHFLARLEAVRP